MESKDKGFRFGEICKDRTTGENFRALLPDCPGYAALSRRVRAMGSAKSRLAFESLQIRWNKEEPENGPWFILKANGGLNGTGNWGNYMTDIERLRAHLAEGGKAWLVKCENDCLDDIFYLTIGVDPNGLALFLRGNWR